MDFTLRVVPLEQILPHETHEEKRVAALLERVQADQRLINPPVVATWAGNYVLLDGATRLAVFQRLGFAHIAVQVIDPLRQDLRLRTWYHGVRGPLPEELLQRLRAIPALGWLPLAADQLQQALVEPCTIACLFSHDGQLYRLRCAQFLPDASGLDHAWLALFNRFVDTYMQWGLVARTPEADFETLRQQFDDVAALVVFPEFSVAQVMELATAGYYVPAGITRFVIPGRVLRLNIPLAELAAAGSLAEKNEWLQQLIRSRLQRRQVRYYQEPVILFDE